MKELRDMTEPEMYAYFRDLAKLIESVLPAPVPPLKNCLFCLLVCDTEGPGISQYASNVQRPGMIKMLRETADRLESRQDITRGPQGD